MRTEGNQEGEVRETQKWGKNMEGEVEEVRGREVGEIRRI